MAAAMARNCLSAAAAAAMTEYKCNGTPPTPRGEEEEELLSRNDFVSLLRKCSNPKGLAQGRQLHAWLSRGGHDLNDTYLGNLVVQMYGKCGSVAEASMVFEKMRRRNIFSWTLMLEAYVQNGCVEDARATLDRMPQRDVVAWTAMVTAYAQNGQGKEAIEVFSLMDLAGTKPNDVTFISVLDACAGMQALAVGILVHESIASRGFNSEVKVGTALVNMYGKCGSVEEAKSVFEKMSQRDVVSWNAMITAFAQNGQSKAAVVLFASMDLEGMKASESSFVNILDACANMAGLAEGKIIHESLDQSGIQGVNSRNALVHMYSKCGNLEEARCVFDRMVVRDVVSWNTMIAAYGENGHGSEALEIFRGMQLEGAKADEITLLSVLSACSHAGLFKDGWNAFVAIKGEHGMSPVVDHYRCMLDILGRAGRLADAHDLINNMPFEPDAMAWMSLLSACRMHENVEQGLQAAQHVFGLSPENAAPYVLLSSNWRMGLQTDNKFPQNAKAGKSSW